MKLRKSLLRVISLFLAVVISIPSSMPVVWVSGSDVGMSTVSSGPLVSIDWVDDEFKNGSCYAIIEDEDTTNAVKLKVSYSNKEVCEEGYDQGELVITVKGIGSVGRGEKIEALVGADKANSGSKDRDWSYTWNKANDTYIFTNNNEIEPNSVLSGYFDMVWEIPSRESINGYNLGDIVASLLLPDGNTVDSNTLSFSNKTTGDNFEVDIETQDMYSYEGLTDGIENPDDYAYVRYNLGTEIVENSRGLSSYRYLFSPDVVGVGSGSVIVGGNTGVEEAENGCYEVVLPLENNYKDNYIFVAYPKDSYGNNVIEASLELLGEYHDGDDSGNTGEMQLAYDSIETVIPSDFNFVDIPGDIYQYWKDTYYDKNVSNDVTEEQGGDIPGNKLVNGTTELFYLEGLFYKPTDVSNGSGNTSGGSTDLGSVYSFEMVDDFIYILKNDGSYRQLGVGEYDFEKVMIPPVEDLLNINGVPIEPEKYAFKVYEFKNGSKVDISTANPSYTGTISNEWVEIVLSSGVTGIAVVIEGLDVSIREFSIPVYVNFHIDDTSMKELGSRDNLSSGQVVNTSFVRLYKDGVWLNTEFDESTYIDDTNLGLAEKDLSLYGSYLDREKDNIALYSGEKSDYEAYTNIDKIEKGSSYYQSEVTIGSDFYFSDEETPDKFSLYTILPDTLDLVGYDIEEDAWDILDIYAFNLDSNIIASRCDTDIAKNYKNSGRVYLGVHFDLSGLDVDKDGFVRVSFPVRVLDKFFDDNLGSVLVRSTVVMDRVIDEYSLGKYEDDGKWCIDGNLASDIDNDGDTDETLSYDAQVASLVYVDSSELQMSKSVKTLTSEGYVQLPEVPLAEESSKYSYELSIRNGESLAKNIIITDILESGSNAKWEGTFQSIDVSDAVEKGLTPTVWYSSSKSPGKVGGSSWSKSLSPSSVEAVAIDFGESELEAGEELNVYINMVAPSDDNNLRGKITENNFSSSFTMIDKATGNSTDSGVLVSNFVQVKLSAELRSLVVVKVDEASGKALNGAKFELINKSTGNVVSSGVTNPKGQVIFKKLPSNLDYVLREVEAPYGYELCEDVDVTFSDSKVIYLRVENKRKTGIAEVYKSNSLDNLIMVDGAEYGLFTLEGDRLALSVTDVNGKAVFSGIEWGSYYIQEVSSPKGYALDTSKYYFEIGRDNIDKIVKFNVKDKQNSPTGVRLVKYEMSVSGVQTETPLSGVVFRLLNVSGGRSSVVGTYVTDSSGEIVIEDLAYGDYRFIESRIPLGFEKTDNIDFSITPSSTVADLVIYNQRKSGSLVLYKHDNLGNSVEGAVFELYDSSKSRVVGTYTTNKYGNISINNLEWGTYYIKEKSTLECYELDDSWHEISINRNNLSESLDLENQTKKGSIVLTKTSETGKVLEGSVFSLYSDSGTLIKENLITDVNGQLKVENLEWGSYYFKETKAPVGYSLTDETVRFSINSLNVGTIQSISVSNPQISKIISITKKICAKDINFANGDPTFLFKVSGVDSYGRGHEYHRILRFDELYVGENTDSSGYVSQSVTVSGLLAGIYRVEEEDSSRFALSGVEGIGSNTSLEGNSVKVDISSENTGGALFTNTRYENGDYSDTDSKANVLKEGIKLTGLKVTWLGDENVEARSNIDRDLLKVEAIYDDGTVRVLENNEWSFSSGFSGNSFPNINGTYSIPVSYTEGGITKTDSFKIVIYGAFSEIVRLEASIVEGYEVVSVNSDISVDMFSVVAVYNDGERVVLEADDVVLDTVKAPSDERVFTVSISLNSSKYEEDVSTSVNMTSRIPEPYLVSGEDFNDLMSNDATSVIFTDDTAPSGVTLLDLSERGDGSVVGWLEGETFKVSSQRKGVKVIANVDCGGMFANKTSVTNMDLSYLDSSRVVSMESMFYHCYYLEGLNLGNFVTDSVVNMSEMFARCNYLKSLDLRNFNTENVKDISDMFSDCKNLESIDLSSFNTKNVRSMAGLFNECRKLSNLIWNSSTFITNNVTDMSKMFAGCSLLGNVDVSWFDTSNVTDMSYMFWDMGSTTEIDVSNFDTSKVTNMYQMFWGNGALEKVDVSSFDTRNVTDMGMMFAYNSVLKELDLSNFAIGLSTDIVSIVIGCDNIKTAYARSQQEADMLNASYMKPTTWDFVSKGTPITLNIVNKSDNLVNINVPSVVESGVTKIRLTPIEEGKLIYSFKLDGVEIFGDTFISPVDSGTVTVSDVEFINIVNESSDKAVLEIPEIFEYGKTSFTLTSLDSVKLIHSFKLNGDIVVGDSFILPEKTKDLVISDVNYLEIVNECPDLMSFYYPSYLMPGNTAVYLNPVVSGDIIYSFKLNGNRVVGDRFVVPVDASRLVLSDVEMMTFTNKCPNLVSFDVSDYAYYNHAEVTLTSLDSSKIIYSYKVNGVDFKGNTFVAPSNKGSEIIISDVVMAEIRNNCSDLVTVEIPSNAELGTSSISLTPLVGNKVVGSFRVNGKLVEGSSFIAMEEMGTEIVITDVTLKEGAIIESEHNPYPNSMNTTNDDGTSGKVYGEVTFDGATSLSIKLDYQTESTSYDWIYLYDSEGNQYGKYGGSTLKSENIALPGNYVKVVFRTDESGNNYYGFRAIVVPEY